MKRALIKWILIFNFMLIGANSVKASEPNWIEIEDHIEHYKASFPQQPIHMQFDIPLEQTQLLGHLDVYSAPLKESLFMLAVLYSPLFTGKELDESQFFRIFYSFIVKRMFYQPQVFKDYHSFKQEKISIEGLPAIRFSISFQDFKVERLLSGIAILKGHKLYTLFYLAPEEDFHKELAQSFFNSFHF